MTTMTPQFGFCFRPALNRSCCSGRLHLWVGDRSSTRTITTPYDVDYEEWDAVEGRLVMSRSDDHRCSQLHCYAESMEQDLRLMEQTIRMLKNGNRNCDVATVVNTFRRQKLFFMCNKG